MTPPPPPPNGTPGPRAADAPGTAAPTTPLDDHERSLDPRIVNVWRVGTAIGLLVLLVPAAVALPLLLGRWGWVAVLAVLAAGATWVVLVPRARYRRWRWRVTDLALELSYGLLVHQRVAVPYFRIQQIDVTQGPVDRLLELATLQVTTASASGSESLPGIRAGDAPVVRAELLRRAAEAVAEHPGEIRDAV